MTLDEFVKTAQSDILKFQEFWKNHQKEEERFYPNNLPLDKWYYEFDSFGISYLAGSYTSISEEE